MACHKSEFEDLTDRLSRGGRKHRCYQGRLIFEAEGSLDRLGPVGGAAASEQQSIDKASCEKGGLVYNQLRIDVGGVGR